MMAGSRSTLLLSIKPAYADAILAGTKWWELRRRPPRQRVGRVFLYATRPVMAIVGECRVLGMRGDTPELLWAWVSQGAGVLRVSYDEYFEGSDLAWSLKLGEPRRFDRPVPLAAVGLGKPPRSFRYLSASQAQLRLPTGWVGA